MHGTFTTTPLNRGHSAIVRSLTDAEPCIEEDGSFVHDLCAFAAVCIFLAAIVIWLQVLS